MTPGKRPRSPMHPTQSITTTGGASRIPTKSCALRFVNGFPRRSQWREVEFLEEAPQSGFGT